jgi:hypothetical protein
MTEEELNKMTVDDVIRWILARCDDEEAMNKINKLTFTFTSKYKKFSEQ